MDPTLIAAPSLTKNADDQRDPEMPRRGQARALAAGSVPPSVVLRREPRDGESMWPRYSAAVPEIGVDLSKQLNISLLQLPVIYESACSTRGGMRVSPQGDG